MIKNQQSRPKLPISHWLFLLFLSAGLSGFSEFTTVRAQVYLTEETGFKQAESTASKVISFSFEQCKSPVTIPEKTGFSKNINLISRRLEQLIASAFSLHSTKPILPTRRNIYCLRHKESSSSPEDLI